MSVFFERALVLTIVGVVAAACGPSAPPPAEPEPDTSKEIEEAADAVGTEVEQGAEEAGDAVEEGADEAGDAVEEAGDDVAD